MTDFGRCKSAELSAQAFVNFSQKLIEKGLETKILEECKQKLTKSISSELSIKFNKQLGKDIKRSINEYKNSLPSDMSEALEEIEYFRQQCVKFAQAAKCHNGVSSNCYHEATEFIKKYKKDDDPSPWD